MNLAQLFSFIPILLAAPSFTSAQELRLEEFLDQVRTTNPSLQASKQRAQAEDGRVRPAGTLDDPFFAVGIDDIPFNGMGSVTRFQLSQSIPFPGKLGARSGIVENRAKSFRADAETTERETTVIATQTFYRVFFNQEAIKLNQRLRGLLSDTVESTKARYRTGDAGHHDWLLAKVELSILEVERLRLERERRTLQAVLNELRGRSPETVIARVSLDLSKASEDTSTNPHDILGSPELKSADALIASTEEELSLAHLSYVPDFVIQAMAMTENVEMSEPSNWGFMVGINLPIFFFRKQSDLSRAAEYSRGAALSQRRALENRLRAELVDAKQQRETARNIVTLYRESVIPTTQLAVDNSRSGYLAKRLPLTQLLEALRIQRTQELEFLAAQIDVAAGTLRLRELLSTPPILRLAPNRPSLFGTGMGGVGAMAPSDTVTMGPGMSGPTRKQSNKSASAPSSDGESMGGM